MVLISLIFSITSSLYSQDLVQLISAPVLEGSGSGFDIKPMKNVYFETTRAVTTICNHLQV